MLVRVVLIVSLLSSVLFGAAVGANICWSFGYSHGYRVRHAIAEEQLADQAAQDRKVNSILLLISEKDAMNASSPGKPGWVETSGGEWLIIPKAHQEWASKIVEGQTVPMPENWREWRRAQKPDREDMANLSQFGQSAYKANASTYLAATYFFAK